MRSLTRRLLGVLLLPLLLLANVPGTGGWYCADGNPCRPAAALSCCCPAENHPADRSARVEDPAEDAAPGEVRCGCYYRSEPVIVAAVHGPAPDVDPGPSLPAAFVPAVEPLVPPTPLSPPAATISPPRHLVSPSDPRGPPRA